MLSWSASPYPALAYGSGLLNSSRQGNNASFYFIAATPKEIIPASALTCNAEWKKEICTDTVTSSEIYMIAHIEVDDNRLHVASITTNPYFSHRRIAQPKIMEDLNAQSLPSVKALMWGDYPDIPMPKPFQRHMVPGTIPCWDGTLGYYVPNTWSGGYGHPPPDTLLRKQQAFVAEAKQKRNEIYKQNILDAMLGTTSAMQLTLPSQSGWSIRVRDEKEQETELQL